MAKLITFKDLNRNSKYSTLNEHMKILFDKDKVLWGQFSDYYNKDNIENKVYKELNNNGNGCIIYAYDKMSMIIKLKVTRVLKTPEVLDEHLEEYIPKYYGIIQPVHYYLEISNMLAIDKTEAKHFITSSGKTLNSYDKMQLNNNRPWNIYELENEPNNLNSLFIINKKIQIKNSKLYNNKDDFEKNYTIYRIYHKDILKYPNAQYIGETNNLKRRLGEHFNPNNILNNKTHNKPLYIAMYILGLENFTYEILEKEIKTEEEAREKESYYINKYQSYIWQNGLNVRKEKEGKNE